MKHVNSKLLIEIIQIKQESYLNVSRKISQLGCNPRDYGDNTKQKQQSVTLSKRHNLQTQKTVI